MFEFNRTTTEQQLFDYITTFLYKQGVPSMRDDDNVCLYPGPQGIMCAVGCIMPDAAYNIQMEGDGVYAMLQAGLARHYGNDSTEFFELMNKHRVVLGALQGAHDDASELSLRNELEVKKAEVRALWLVRFDEIASDFNLKFNAKELPQ